MAKAPTTNNPILNANTRQMTPQQAMETVRHVADLLEDFYTKYAYTQRSATVGGGNMPKLSKIHEIIRERFCGTDDRGDKSLQAGSLFTKLQQANRNTLLGVFASAYGILHVIHDRNKVIAKDERNFKKEKSKKPPMPAKKELSEAEIKLQEIEEKQAAKEQKRLSLQYSYKDRAKKKYPLDKLISEFEAAIKFILEDKMPHRAPMGRYQTYTTPGMVQLRPGIEDTFFSCIPGHSNIAEGTRNASSSSQGKTHVMAKLCQTLESVYSGGGANIKSIMNKATGYVGEAASQLTVSPGAKR